ncbi:MAG TPA: hypothetical protein PKZ17_00720 [Thermodesulfovibrio thiophilus]|uniref:hypothetical protein n=1 Tax=Thermodesulfovibrio thiophilus TaxID=340095 RepID=UPI00181F1C6B|nr:hypothetical protein [Thermodesulfovibrio thiophilus]HHW20633.1 hypothetical protein [Thermodesulfovibrio thiophilus]HQA03241.1 hypothetical protein [Thermodesulfovibrio thiophilus]
MNPETLNMILKLREWDEEVEKQKFATLLSERRRIETCMKELEERFNFMPLSYKELSSEKLLILYSEIAYITEQLIEIKKIIEQINHELEKQRETYELAFKERKKIDQLYDRLITKLKLHREKVEETITSDTFISRIRGE